MGIKNIDLQDGIAITLDDTSSTSAQYREDGITISNGFHAVATVDADYMLRRQLTCKIKQPVLDTKTRKYGKGKKSVSLAFPMLDPIDNTVIFNTFRLELENHPSVDSQEILNMRKIAAQAIMSSTTDDFWRMGTIN